MLAYYPDRSSPLLVTFGQGAAPPEAYMQKSPGKTNLTWEETLAARLVGCHGSAGHSDLVAAVCTEARQGFGIGHEARQAFETRGNGVA